MNEIKKNWLWLHAFVCPQHLKISELLDDVAVEFEK